MTVIFGRSRHIAIPALAGVRVFSHGGGAAWEPDDWWSVSGKTCIAAYQPKGAPSYAESLTNLANPGTYDAAEGDAPTWDTGVGWTFDQKWLRTGLTPGSTYSLIVNYTLTEASGYALAAGSFVSSPVNCFYIYPANPYGDFSMGWGSEYYSGYINPPAQNTRRTDAITPASYYGAATKIGNWSSPTWNTANELYVGARHYDDDANSGACGIALHALAVYDGTLSDSDVTAQAAAMAAL